MIQAFNLAQLANNLNSSGQIDATDGSTGLTTNANLASSGTADATTYLRGDRIWDSVSQKFRQIAQVQSTTSITTSVQGTWVSTGLSQSITPLSTNSKILCIVHCPIRYGTNNGGGDAGIRIDRSGTAIFTDTYKNNVSVIVDISYTVDLFYLDSPATTSALTYTIQFALTNASGVYANPTVCWNTSQTPITFSLIEVAL